MAYVTMQEALSRMTPKHYEVIVRKRLKSVRSSARKRGLEFTLTIEAMCNLLNKPYGQITGIPLMASRLYGGNCDIPWFCLTIERLDSNVGYTPDNCVAEQGYFNSIRDNAPSNMIALERSLTKSKLTGIITNWRQPVEPNLDLLSRLVSRMEA